MVEFGCRKRQLIHYFSIKQTTNLFSNTLFKVIKRFEAT